MGKADKKKKKKQRRKEQQQNEQKALEVKTEEQVQIEVEEEAEAQKLKLPLMIALVVISLVVFLMTLNPHMGPGDSGTIISMSYLAGINHPPGYPLYTMLGKLFTYLPFGSVGFRVNFMNSVMTITAAVFFFLAFLRTTKNAWGSFLGAALMCFAPGIWHYAVIAEVFPLNNMMIALLFYCLVIYVQTKDKKWAYLGTLMFGLGVSNHHTIVFFGFPFAGLVLYAGKDELLNPLEILKICLIFFVGLTPYLFLVYAPNVHHVESWGETTTYAGFMKHLFRKEYGTFSLRSDLKGGSFFQGIYEYFKQLPLELFFVGPVLGFWGAYQSWKRGARYNGLLFITIFSYLLYVIAFHKMSKFDLSNPYYYGIVYRFWQMPLLIVCFWIAIGFKELHLLKKFTRPVSIAIVVFLVGGQIAFNYNKMDQSKNDIYYRLGKNLLENMPKDAIMLIKGDIFINTMIYVQYCEGIRPDITILNIGRMKGPWYGPKVTRNTPFIKFPRNLMVPIGQTPQQVRRPDGYTITEFIKMNFGSRPIFTNLHYIAFKTANQHFDLWPWGLVYEVVPKGTVKPNHKEYIDNAAKILTDFVQPPGFEPAPFSHEEIVANYYHKGLEVQAMQFANLAQRNKWGIDFIYKAIELINLQIKRTNIKTADNLKNIGLLYSMVPGGRDKQIEIWREFLKIADRTHPAYNYIVQKMREMKAL